MGLEPTTNNRVAVLSIKFTYPILRRQFLMAFFVLKIPTLQRIALENKN